MRKVKVWINAFIPRDVPGLSKPAPGIHAESTMLPGPFAAVTDCFLTDNRDFSSNVHASSRMHSEIEIDLNGPTEIFQWHNCDSTVEVDCENGEKECELKGKTNRMAFHNLRGSPRSLIHVDITAASHNPCFAGSPDIDYEGTFTIGVVAKTVEFDGMIDEFPAFECYASADGGSPRPLFQTRPLPGSSPWNLPGGATRAQFGKIQF